MTFYRYETVEYAQLDYDGEYMSCAIIFPDPKIKSKEFNLFKETPKGYWIGYGKPDGLKGFQRWVSKTSRKRYAYPTKAEALNNFIKRNQARIKILKRQLQVCEIVVRDAQKMEF